LGLAAACRVILAALGHTINFAGLLDEITIYNHALSAKEIKAVGVEENNGESSPPKPRRSQRIGPFDGSIVTLQLILCFSFWKAPPTMAAGFCELRFLQIVYPVARRLF